MAVSPLKSKSVLIVGCGSIGRRHARILSALGMADLRITDPSAAQRAVLRAETRVSAEFTSLEEALRSGPQCVFICTPPSLHVAQSVQAFAAGAHVFCEKPLAESAAGIEVLREAIARTRKTFAVGFCMRHHAALRLAKTWVEAGRIGRLVSIRCRMGEHLPTVRPDYKTLFVLKEAGAFDLAHEIDLACWFAGQPVSEVQGMCGAYSDLGFTAPDLVEVIARFGKDCLASIHLDWFGAPRLRETQLIGTRGTIRVEYASWTEATASIFELTKGEWEATALTMERDDMFRAEDEEFLAATETGGPVSCDFAGAEQSLRIVEHVAGQPR